MDEEEKAIQNKFVLLEEGECKKLDDVVVCKDNGKIQIFKKKEE